MNVNPTSRIVAYFDTNIFDNILKKTGGVVESDETLLRAAIESGRLSLVTSVLNISETIDARRPELVLPQLKLIPGLTDWDRFVKPCDVLLTDDIRHFAWNGEPDRPFISDSNLGRLHSALRRILDGRDSIQDFGEIIDDDIRQKEQFQRRISDVRAETYAQIQELKQRGEITTFESYLQDRREDVARELARRVGREEECNRMGLMNLLKIPSVRITVGLHLSFIYRAAVEDRTIKGSASRDLQHAPPAAAATDVFVTHDKELALLLNRVPMTSFKVITLRELLDEVS